MITCAKGLTSGLLLSPSELSEEASEEWTRGGPPVAIECGAPFIESLMRAGIGVRWRMAPVPLLDDEFFRAPSLEALGRVATENLTHFVASLAVASRSAIHLKLLEGDNDHHRAEAAVKALALALRQALAPIDLATTTKGVL